MAGVLNRENTQFDKKTPEERAELGRRGGIASAKAKKERKAMREVLENLLGMPLKNGDEVDVESIQSFAALKGKNITVQDALIIAQIQKALKGDTTAAVFVRDTSGQKPVENHEVEMNLPVFFEGEDELEE